MATYSRRRSILVGLLLFVWLAISACTCSGIFGTSVATPVTLAPPSSPTPTHAPSPTSTPLPSTVLPTLEPVHGLGNIPGILEERDAPFVIELTEAELNEYLAGETFDLEGARLQDVQVTIRENELMCSFRATQTDSGLSAGLTVRGTPIVADGAAYFQVHDVTLDPSVKGFARLIAKAAIEAAIKQYSTPHGIPIPMDQVEFQDVQLSPGKILIVGRTL